MKDQYFSRNCKFFLDVVKTPPPKKNPKPIRFALAFDFSER